MTNVVGVLLAAGAARRFGADKLCHPLEDGTPLGVVAGRNLIEALPVSVAVLRPGERVLATALAALGFTVVRNEQPELGMGASLARGVAAAGSADGWMIALADMPWIRPATMLRLRQRLGQGASMVAPSFRGQRGHPVGFRACWRSELLALRADRGARELLQRHPDELLLEAVLDPGVVTDIDTPADLVGASAAGSGCSGV
jgi:molybdenum cofactor cytidylyltransferase